MLGKLKELLGGIKRGLVEGLLYKTISEESLAKYCDDLLLRLVEADVAYDVAEALVSGVKEALVGQKARRGEKVEELVEEALASSLRKLLERGRSEDFANRVRALASKEPPVKVVFMGVNGVGKTTTIAKIAHLLKGLGLKPLIVAADTFRAGAQEQLRKHAERLSIPFLGGRYGADPAAVAYDGVVYAAKHGRDVILIDTAGRMHVDADLMNELRKVVRVVAPHFKVLIVDALTGNDAIEQAKRFDEAVGVDGVILTKVDADASGGPVLTVIAGIMKPIFYLGVGQRYEDLIRYDPELVLKMLLK